ncbi:hypothetical protein JTE90_010138 [Oedothorax gibbosus]|uniref:CAP-Gly domain-containing protein n=1 Tax=Oedothorax gibbosus TaxID=931172 RepID=A0AAV6UHF3_9ARAC|nr:hypothetical protein JTE90_010138 [Oedothorax gibbosus]
MYQTRGASWIGFEDAQRAINALKEEIEQAEKKLSKADQALKLDRRDASSRISQQTSSTSVIPNISNKNELRKPFVKEVVPKHQLHKNKPHKRHGKLTAPKVIRFSSDSEDQPNFVPSKIHSLLPTRIEISKITSSDSSSSHKNLNYDSSSSGKTSSLIADTYANIDSKLSSLIERNEKKKDAVVPKIAFTYWEKEFLKSYADISDVEMMSSQSDKPLENITNGMEWTPVFNNSKLPRTKKIVDDGLGSLKQIIERQKRLHEEISKSERSQSPSENFDHSLKPNPGSREFPSKDITYTDIEAEAQVRPPPVRKVRLVTALPRYRGFSTPGSFPTGNSQSKFKFSKKTSHSNTDKKTTTLQKQSRRITITNKNDVTESPAKKNKETTEDQEEEDSENIQNRIEKDADSNPLSHDASPVSPQKDMENIPDSKLIDEILSDNDKENSLNDHSTDTHMSSNKEVLDKFLDKSEKKSEEQFRVPKFIPCKSVKRKAFKVHADEKMAPSPKIRHYDTKSVRDYIKKKKAERRKRHMEEHKKSLEEVERKKESLQKLLEFQKQCLNVPNPKTLSPSKPSQSKVETKTKDSELHLSSSECILPNKDNIENVHLDTTKKSQLPSNKKFIGDLHSNSLQKDVNQNENIENYQQKDISEVSQKKKDKEVQTNFINVELETSDKTHSEANYINVEPNTVSSDRTHSEMNYVNKGNHANKLQEVSLTSIEYQSSNVTGYLSSINSSTELSQLPSLDEFLPQLNLENKRSKFSKGKLLPAEALKNLVKSIDERTAPYEHLVRTKAWVDQSPPPPNRKSAAKTVPQPNFSPRKSTKDKMDTDFVVDVAKSLHSLEKSSFIEQVKDIGDTSNLYTQLLGNISEDKRNTSYRENTLREVAKASSPTVIDSHGYHLVEGSLESESSVYNENNANSKITSHDNREAQTPSNLIISEFETPKVVPDPFNLINTWIRKPLGIPISPKESEVIPTEQDTTNRVSDYAKNSQDIETSTCTSPMYSSFASESIKSFQNSVKQSTSPSNQSETPNENKSLSGYSSRTLTPNSYTSVATGSSTSQTLNSRNNSENEIGEPENLHLQPENNRHETGIKEKSPSESSISEIVSVIVNSKNGEQVSMDVPNMNSSSSKVGSPEEQKLSDVVENASDVSSNHEVLKSLKGSIQEDMEGSFHENDDQKQIFVSSRESSPASAISEAKSPSIPSEEKELSEENISEVSLTSEKDVFIDFTQPVRLALSDGVPKSLKILKDSVVNTEQYRSPQVVIRVGSEAATGTAVIAVSESQKKLPTKEHEESRLSFPVPPKTELSQEAKSDSSASPNSGSPNYEQDQFEQISNGSVEEIFEEKASSTSTVKEDLNSSRESSNLYGHASVSTKSSTSNVAEDLSVVEKLKEKKQISNKRSRHLSSPSPPSLSENDSISSIAMASSNYAPSSSAANESLLSDDSFARLTEDVVRKMSHEEKRRATHQLAVLRFEEKTLVEKTRDKMALLESIKKNLRAKGKNAKASHIKKLQKDLISKLRHERAHLRCMQEAYRSMCEMNHTMLTEDKKNWHGHDMVAYQFKKSKEKSQSTKPSSEHKIEMSRTLSGSSSTSAILTEEDVKEAEEVHEVDTQMSKSVTTSSQDSIIETFASEKTISTVSSHSQTPKISPTPFSQSKQGVSQPSPSFNSNESALQGLKKLEASKRHLTKREQRIFQRRKQAEKLLQLQKKLDTEEMAVRELEQKAIELVDKSKKKTRYYLSPSPSATPNALDDDKTPEKSKVSDSVDGNILSEHSLTVQPDNKSNVSELIQIASNPEENITAVSGDSIDEALSRKTNNGTESSSALSASSVLEIEKSVNSSIKTAENTGESSGVEEAITNGTSSTIKSDSKKDMTSDAYSESFDSAPSQVTLSPVSNSPIIKTSTPSPTSKKGRNFSIKSPISPHRFRRHDSSGSDDSYTISHSETASDQSDIEVRIHALSEELRRRKYEADKLKREKKRKYREQLKGTELSLQKQVEAYDQYIKQVKAELEQIESGPSQSQVVDISSVKPQIKWPRPEQVIDSRCIRKKSLTSDTVLLEQKRSIDQVSSSPEYSEIPFEYPKKKGELPKKLFPTTKDDTSPEKVPKPDVLETNDHKVTDTNVSVSTENISSNKISEFKSETLNKLNFTPKDESEVEESYESNISIGTADIISEKSSTSIKDINSKSIQQSDSFVSSSSVSQSIKTLDEESVEEKADSTIENETTERVSKFTTESQDSEQNSEGGKITPSESSQSSGEYTSGSFVSTITNSDSVKDFESGSLEEAENSDGTLSVSSKKSLDSTSGKHKSDSSDNSTSKSQLLSNKNEKPNKAKHLKVLKSQSVIVNLVTYLSSSMLDDAIRTVINISNNHSKYVPVNHINKVSQKNNCDAHNLALVHKLTEKSIEIIIDDILKLYLKDAFKSIINIANDFQKHNKSHKEDINESLNNNQTPKPTTNISPIESNKPSVSITNDIPEVRTDLVATTIQEKNDNSIFKKQTDWLDDGFVSTPWDTQQLEQQLLLQQYPYLYRKIPNKPPPPYTPPSQTSFPLPIKREKPVEKVDPIKHVTKNIGAVVGCVVDSLLEGKKKGLMVSEITGADFSSVVELRNSCQLTFLDLVFDLTKEIALEIYRDKDEARAPWERVRKLTPKPKFPTDKAKIISTLLKEVERALKLSVSAAESHSEQMRKKPTWASMKLGRKKRDFVDTILIREIKQEEPDWVNYDQEEIAVKKQMADSIFDYLVDDTVQLIKTLEGKFHK